jgi:hypothetical protein
VIAPETPTGGAIRQAVLDDQADGGIDNASRVVAARVGQIGHLGVEVLTAASAIVLGVEYDNVAWPSCEGVTEVVEHASCPPIAVSTVSTLGTGSSPVIAAAATEIGLGQVHDASDALGGVGSVFARPWHDESPGSEDLPGNTQRDGVLFTNTAR